MMYSTIRNSLQYKLCSQDTRISCWVLSCWDDCAWHCDVYIPVCTTFLFEDPPACR